METNQAAENLQVIRTLMERSALYRRALAPIMLVTGCIGILTGLVGRNVATAVGFISLWCAAALAAVICALLLARRQALKDSEPFWSPPTRRVAQAMIPPMFAGLCITVIALVLFDLKPVGDLETGATEMQFVVWLPVAWAVLYGCALHAAGYFTPAGVRGLGWLFLLCGLAVLAVQVLLERPFVQSLCQYFMAIVFGGLHFVAGIYLYFTEKRGNEA